MAQLECRAARFTLPQPLTTAWGELHERTYIEVRLSFSPADFGCGEAAPLQPYDGVSLESVSAALEVYSQVLRDVDCELGDAEILDRCRRAHDLPQALAAIDLALFDRAGRRAGLPVARLLVSDPVPTIAVNATIAAADPAAAASEAAAAARAGFSCVKVKVGHGDDVARVAGVRAAIGSAVALRIDANDAWSTAAEAIDSLRALAPYGIELAEEPVAGVAALREVRAAGIMAIAIDETDAPGAGVADAVCLKISRCGGIGGLLEAARAARAAGSVVYVASTFDGPVGIAAGLHAAAALAPSLHCGLATSQHPLLGAVSGSIAVPTAPGLLA